MAAEDLPSPQDEQTEAPAVPSKVTDKTFNLTITSDGQYVLNDDAVTPVELEALIQSEAGQEGAWKINLPPSAASSALSSITALLDQEGVSAVQIATASASTPPLDTPPLDTPPLDTPPLSTLPPAGPTVLVAAAAPIVPIAEVRFGGSATGLTSSEELLLSAVINRAAVGAAGTLGEHISTAVLMEAVEVRDESSTGYVVRPRDAYIRFPVISTGQVTATIGVQEPIFGQQTWFDDDADGFYTVSQRFQSVTVLSALHGVRVMGAAATARLQKDRGEVSVMMSNTGDAAVAEDNNGKDVSARLQYTLSEPVTIALSGRSGSRNIDDSGSLTAGDAAVRIKYGAISGLFEGVIGVNDDGSGDTDQPTFGGTNIALTAGVPLPIELLDTLRVTGRLAFFDPNLSTRDADAWLQNNVGLTVSWQTTGTTQLLSGLGYEVYVPIDATIPISHRALVETIFQF
ncbi:MAG: hypothetical protein P8R54_10720 [Myxococcota bacterium]|nr:hypothetical protein [Myxococcota bacterium]